MIETVHSARKQLRLSSDVLSLIIQGYRIQNQADRRDSSVILSSAALLV